MQNRDVYRFLTTELSSSGLGAPGGAPTLDEAFEVWKEALAPGQGSQIHFVGVFAAFAEVLRGVGKASLYSDEDWIEFIQAHVDVTVDEARDMWDAAVCQPEA